MLSSTQIGQDGTGQEQTLYGTGIRLKAKDLTTTRSTTLKITGMLSGAVWYVDLIVRTGEPIRFNPPAKTTTEQTKQQDTKQRDTKEGKRETSKTR